MEIWDRAVGDIVNKLYIDYYGLPILPVERIHHFFSWSKLLYLGGYFTCIGNKACVLVYTCMKSQTFHKTIYCIFYSVIRFKMQLLQTNLRCGKNKTGLLILLYLKPNRSFYHMAHCLVTYDRSGKKWQTFLQTTA